jgi:hypothetical protein
MQINVLGVSGNPNIDHSKSEVVEIDSIPIGASATYR